MDGNPLHCREKSAISLSLTWSVFLLVFSFQRVRVLSIFSAWFSSSLRRARHLTQILFRIWGSSHATGKTECRCRRGLCIGMLCFPLPLDYYSSRYNAQYLLPYCYSWLSKTFWFRCASDTLSHIHKSVILLDCVAKLRASRRYLEPSSALAFPSSQECLAELQESLQTSSLSSHSYFLVARQVAALWIYNVLHKCPLSLHLQDFGSLTLSHFLG